MGKFLGGVGEAGVIYCIFFFLLLSKNALHPIRMT